MTENGEMDKEIKPEESLKEKMVMVDKRMEVFEKAMKEEKSAIELWREQSRHYEVSTVFKELGGKERREERNWDVWVMAY